MLDKSVLDQVKSAFSGLKSSFTIQATVAEGHEKREAFLTLLQEVASCSDKLSINVNTGTGLSFTVEKEGVSGRIEFRGIPTGHEFSTLLVWILNADGIGKNLPDEALNQKIEGISKKFHFKTFISLTCTNCPDVVKAINILALLNPNISHEIVEGSLYQDEVEKAGIQAVPTVWLNGESFLVGRTTLGEVMAKLEELHPDAFESTTSIVEREYDLVVVGGGPAGVSSAIYTARKGLSVALIAETVGGQLTETLAVENMISIPKTTGAQLTSGLIQHIEDYAIDVYKNRRVVEARNEDGVKTIKTNLGEIFNTKALIIATGAGWKRLGVDGEKDYIGQGVAFCAHCDGPLFKNKEVVVIGGGNSGLEAAIDLSGLASKVKVLEYADELRGDTVLQEKLKQLSHVDVVTSAQTTEILGNGSKVTGLKYTDRTSGQNVEVNTDGVFVQIGLKPNTFPFEEMVKLTPYGEIEIDAHCRTSVPGIYAAGDVTNVPYKQIVIAMGEGSKAALSAFEDRIKNRLV